jgi:hypothetical protein
VPVATVHRQMMRECGEREGLLSRSDVDQFHGAGIVSEHLSERRGHARQSVQGIERKEVVMNRRILWLALAVALTVTAPCAPLPAWAKDKPADTILTNGYVYTEPDGLSRTVAD